MVISRSKIYYKTKIVSSYFSTFLYLLLTVARHCILLFFFDFWLNPDSVKKGWKNHNRKHKSHGVIIIEINIDSHDSNAAKVEADIVRGQTSQIINIFLNNKDFSHATQAFLSNITAVKK